MSPSVNLIDKFVKFGFVSFFHRVHELVNLLLRVSLNFSLNIVKLILDRATPTLLLLLLRFLLLPGRGQTLNRLHVHVLNVHVLNVHESVSGLGWPQIASGGLGHRGERCRWVRGVQVCHVACLVVDCHQILLLLCTTEVWLPSRLIPSPVGLCLQWGHETWRAHCCRRGTDNAFESTTSCCGTSFDIRGVGPMRIGSLDGTWSCVGCVHRSLAHWLLRGQQSLQIQFKLASAAHDVTRAWRQLVELILVLE